MELKGKHGYLHKIFDNELQIENFKKTIYDVSNNVIDVLYRVVGNDNSTINSILWRCGVFDMIEALEELMEQPSDHASHDALDEKMQKQIQELQYLLKTLEELELDFIFINN